MNFESYYAVSICRAEKFKTGADVTYAISNTEGDHLGFILLSGGPDAGDCLVRSLPVNGDKFDLPESEYLYALQQMGELRWERVSEEFRICGPDGGALLTEKQGRMTGAGLVFAVEALSQ